METSAKAKIGVNDVFYDLIRNTFILEIKPILFITTVTSIYTIGLSAFPAGGGGLVHVSSGPDMSHRGPTYLSGD